MILIKLSAHRNIKMAGIVAAIALTASVIIVVGASSVNLDSSNTDPVDSANSLTTESYESETQNEGIDTTLSIPETTPPAPEKETQQIEDVAPEKIYVKYYTDQDAVDIAKVLYHECRGIPSVTQKACVVWTILNRVDAWNSSVYVVVRKPYQYAFSEYAPVWDELLHIAHDVLYRWNLEKNGETDVGRVLPKNYLYFEGDGNANYFKDNYPVAYNIWNYTLESPYEN